MFRPFDQPPGAHFSSRPISDNHTLCEDADGNLIYEKRAQTLVRRYLAALRAHLAKLPEPGDRAQGHGGPRATQATRRRGDLSRDAS